MHPERRADEQAASVIDQALDIDRAEGAIKAWLYLMRNGVPSETIQRVLALGAYHLDVQPAGITPTRRRR